MVPIQHVRPPRWTDAGLDKDRLISLQLFIAARQAQKLYAGHFSTCLGEVTALYGATANLTNFTGAVFSSAPELASALARSDPGSLARKNPGARGVTGASAPS